eukprot:14093930-Alexandrium_andersonii.AAC.1
MSASLVGSEMCIRDRKAPRPAAPAAQGAPAASRASSSSSRAGVPKQVTFCLLYTSDAADDM